MEQFVNRGSKRTQHQWSEASKYHPDYLLKSNLAHHFVQRFWPSKGFTFLFGLFKWGCPNVPCILHMGIPKDQEGNAACRPSGPYLLPNYFLLRFLVYQKTALFSTSCPPLFVHLFVTDVTSQLFYLSGQFLIRQKHTLLSLILFLNLDPPSRPKCDSWACGMNDFFYWWI